MNKNLENALAEIINRVVSGADASVLFLESQLPDVVNQLLLFNTIKYGLISSLLVIACIILWRLVCSSFKRILNDKCSNKPDSSMIFIGGCSMIFLCIISVVNIIDLIKITIAPKVWLIEYAADLVK